MLKEYRDSYITKYGSPFAAYAFANVSPSDCDEDASDEVGGSWVGRIGRRVMVEDAQGFANVYRFATVQEAEETFTLFAPLFGDEVDEEPEEVDEVEEVEEVDRCSQRYASGARCELPKVEGSAYCTQHAGGLIDELRQAERDLG